MIKVSRDGAADEAMTEVVGVGTQVMTLLSVGALRETRYREV